MRLRAGTRKVASMPRSGALAALLLAAADPAAAQEAGTDLRRFLYDDATATLHLRSYYLDRTNPSPPNNVAWAGGGWVGYETGWLANVLRLGVVGYTTQPIRAPSDTDGTSLLKSGQYGFWTLGEAYASIKLHHQVFTAYRQHLDEFEVNPQDDRMIPNLFEAYALRGTLGGHLSYVAGYVTRMKLRNQSEFDNMAQTAVNQYGRGNSVPSTGLYLGALRYTPRHDVTLSASTYHVPDILSSGYSDIAWSAPMPEPMRLTLSSNVMVQGSSSDTLIGKPFSTWSAGGRAILGWHDATVWTAYMQTGSASNYRTPYGQWIGYGKMITKDFNRANERAFQVGATYDFAGLGIHGLSFRGSGTFGSGAINPDSGAEVTQNTEFDFDLEYKFASAPWPEWLKPLALRGRAGLVQENLGGRPSSSNEYRLILNYEVSFKGGKQR
jgi:imipenem/basic amino acid-specific outer membrane pore